jgi:hypothetical protein
MLQRVSVLKVELVCSYEMLVSAYQTKRCHNLQDDSIDLVVCTNLLLPKFSQRGLHRYDDCSARSDFPLFRSVIASSAS